MVIIVNMCWVTSISFHAGVFGGKIDDNTESVQTDIVKTDILIILLRLMSGRLRPQTRNKPLKKTTISLKVYYMKMLMKVWMMVLVEERISTGLWTTVSVVSAPSAPVESAPIAPVESAPGAPVDSASVVLVMLGCPSARSSCYWFVLAGSASETDR